MKRTVLATALSLTTFTTGHAFAAFDLQVTEIWAGNNENPDLTEDWFEVTNLGDTAWTAASDGDLYFDDVSADPADAVIMAGIASIAPGESVIYVNDGDDTEWLSVWASLLTTVPQVGIHDGAGLGGGGDAVALFLDPEFDGIAGGELPFEVASYPDTDGTPGESYDVLASTFSGSVPGAITTAPNTAGEPAVGTPGFTAIPEPASLVLLGLGGLALVGRRRNA